LLDGHVVLTQGGKTSNSEHLEIDLVDYRLQQTVTATPTATPASATSNETPYSAALRCLSGVTRTRPIRIAVGQIADDTGGTESDGSGRKVIAGASQMAMNALAKAGVPVVESRRDGADFYLAGGIIELNFNIRSENGNGNGGSLHVMNIGMDLRLINSATLEVIDVARVQKQIIGRQVSPGVFSFLGTNFFDPAMGESALEPVQLALRSVIERGVMEMIGKAYSASGACPVAVDYLRG
jgi:curli production assembly/transport component CsgG/holdfast attachment protein HfaB